MAAAIYDLGALTTQRVAKATARDQARSAVLGRFDAADARRQFTLEQADAARANQAARAALSRTEQGRATPVLPKADEREAPAKAAPRESTAKAPAEKDTTRAAATRSEANAARSEPKRGAADKPAAKSDAKAAASGKSEQPSAAADASAPHESEATGEQQAVAEVVVPTLAVAPQAEASTASTPASPIPQGGQQAAGASPEQSPEMQEAATAATGFGAKSAGAAASASAAENTSQPAGNAQAAAPDAGTSFSALLDTVEPTAATSTGTPAPSVAKSASGVDGASGSPTAQNAAAPVPLGAVPMTIALRSLQNASQFEIRLDPLELGRIDVRLDIDKESGTVSADLVVDRPSTLALLQRDAGTLQQALSQAGLDASGGISLSLRDGGGSQDRGDGASRNTSGASRGAPSRTATDSTDPIPVRALRLSGLDIRI